MFGEIVSLYNEEELVIFCKLSASGSVFARCVIIHTVAHISGKTDRMFIKILPQTYV